MYKYIITIFIDNNKNAVKFPFIRKFNELLFRFNFIIKNYAFTLKRLYILELYIKNIL